MKVRLTAHWRDHLPGDVVDAPEGRELIYDGVAVEVAKTAARERAPKPHKAAAATPDEASEPDDDDAGAATP